MIKSVIVGVCLLLSTLVCLAVAAHASETDECSGLLSSMFDAHLYPVRGEWAWFNRASNPFLEFNFIEQMSGQAGTVPEQKSVEYSPNPISRLAVNVTKSEESDAETTYYEVTDGTYSAAHAGRDPVFGPLTVRVDAASLDQFDSKTQVFEEVLERIESTRDEMLSTLALPDHILILSDYVHQLRTIVAHEVEITANRGSSPVTTMESLLEELVAKSRTVFAKLGPILVRIEADHSGISLAGEGFRAKIEFAERGRLLTRLELKVTLAGIEETIAYDSPGVSVVNSYLTYKRKVYESY